MRLAVTVLALATLLTPLVASADVITNSASGAPSYEKRGATETSFAGDKLASELHGKPVVARIHADWCPACKASAETYTKLQAQYAGKATFVTFDVTDAKTAAQAQENAKKLGILKFFQSARAATSTVAVIDGDTGHILGTLYNDSAIEDYDRVMDVALAHQHK